LELLRVPAVVRGYDLRVPVLFDKIFKIFSVCWSRVRDIVIRKPSFKLRLMPFVVN
jgi:hypothetical protein